MQHPCTCMAERVLETAFVAAGADVELCCQGCWVLWVIQCSTNPLNHNSVMHPPPPVNICWLPHPLNQICSSAFRAQTGHCEKTAAEGLDCTLSSTVTATEAAAAAESFLQASTWPQRCASESKLQKGQSKQQQLKKITRQSSHRQRQALWHPLPIRLWQHPPVG